MAGIEDERAWQMFAVEENVDPRKEAARIRARHARDLVREVLTNSYEDFTGYVPLTTVRALAIFWFNAVLYFMM